MVGNRLKSLVVNGQVGKKNKESKNEQNKESEVGKDIGKIMAELHKESRPTKLNLVDQYIIGMLYEDVVETEIDLYKGLGMGDTDKDGTLRKYAFTAINGTILALAAANYNPDMAVGILGGLGALRGMEGAKMLGYEDVANKFSDFYDKFTKMMIEEKPGEKPKVPESGESHTKILTDQNKKNQEYQMEGGTYITPGASYGSEVPEEKPEGVIGKKPGEESKVPEGGTYTTSGASDEPNVPEGGTYITPGASKKENIQQWGNC